MVPDPMAEIYVNASPYNYVNNSPINNYDPNGMWWSDDLSREESMYGYEQTTPHADGNYSFNSGGVLADPSGLAFYLHNLIFGIFCGEAVITPDNNTPTDHSTSNLYSFQ